MRCAALLTVLDIDISLSFYSFFALSSAPMVCFTTQNYDSASTVLRKLADEENGDFNNKVMLCSLAYLTAVAASPHPETDEHASLVRKPCSGGWITLV